MIQRMLVALGALIVAGCGTLGNKYDAERVSAVDAAEAAFVVLSTGTPEKCLSATSTILRLKEIWASYKGQDVVRLAVDGYATKSDFTDHYGSLHVLKLEPGQYYLAPWVPNPFAQPVRVGKSKFSVAAGEVVYLGEYFMATSCVYDPYADFRDQEERDLKLLAEKNPTLASRKITKRIAAYTSYIVGGGT